MRLDPLFDSFHALGSLWGALTSPSVCTAVPNVLPRAAYEAPRPMAPAVVAVTAFVNVNVIPMDTERVLANYAVLVEGGRITALGPANKIKVPDGAVQIDGRGKYLMPGLTDMHTHYDHMSKAKLQDIHYRMFATLASGVTTVRELGAVPLKFLPLIRHLNSGGVPAPRILISPLMEELERPKPRLDSVTAYVAAYKAAGYSFIDIPDAYMHAPSRGAGFDSLMAAARRLGLPISNHTHLGPPDRVPALGAAGGSMEHLFHLGIPQQLPGTPQAIQAAVAMVRGAGLWVTPTLNCIEDRKGHNEDGLLRSSPWRPFVKALHDAGVGLLLGSDADFPWRRSPSMVHNELAALVHAGLTPYQALVTGTRNPARYFGMLDSTGTVAVGKRADLVLLSGNPLAEIRHTREPAGVMLAGRWFDRATLDQGLAMPPLAPSPHSWMVMEMLALEVADSDILPTTQAQRGKLKAHLGQFDVLTDSLAGASWLESERLLRLLAEELGAMRAILTPAQHERFDPVARVWLRAQARQGYQVTVPGVGPTP
jgi:imidazolonepropionase-like amidohydrolase